MSWDGKMYNKYKIEHTDGTPLKGKKYFVLRLDSDDPIEAARVARAMRAYEGKPRNCDMGTVEELKYLSEKFGKPVTKSDLDKYYGVLRQRYDAAVLPDWLSLCEGDAESTTKASWWN